MCVDLQALCFGLRGLRVGFELILEFYETSRTVLKLDVLRGCVLQLVVQIELGGRRVGIVDVLL